MLAPRDFLMMSIETRRILLICADDEISEMMMLCLETISHWEIITVNSGVEGIERAVEVDAILLDLDQTMPDLCWREIFQNLKQNSQTKSTPILLLTATPQSPELVEFQATESVTAISKPFNLLNLANQIFCLLG